MPEKITPVVTKKTVGNTKVRWNVMFLAFLGIFIAYMDRVNLSVATPSIMKEFGWNTAQFGVILSAFFIGYAILQIPSGWLSDHIGGRRVLAAGMGWWSLFTMLTPAGNTIGLMTLIRSLLGFGEAVTFPAITSVVSCWMSPSERARAQGFNLSGMLIGSGLTIPLVAWIVKSFGWQWTFYSFGIVGIIWTIIWLKYVTDNPAEHPGTSQDELNEICQGENLNDQVRAEQASGNLGSILKSKSVWGLALAYFMQNYNWYLILTWLPGYLVMARGFNLIKTGIYGMFPYLGAFLFANLAGQVSDRLSKHYGSTKARKIILYISFAGSAVFLYLGAHAVSPIMAVVFITVCVSFVGMNFAPFWALPVDMAPRNAGFVSGFMNTSGTIAGILAPMLTGFIVNATGSWIYALSIAMVCSILGIVINLALISAKPVTE
ncbi:MFS transporter [Desulfotomaculum copahuensis]|uniref:Major facilitator superfamily (MFS) profile domain-containing protein n=1 Tax=Desulfotomaculum copahuensis TaxID=1838280 RepID=A0A1B7LIE3_9FIRM|nr:MFS transporter [Desulfotomaculum copahuensis]OAT86334.1 hypothetical protein A6M21_03810 [Desulfotomaculum copahuensis]